jgi:CheY-like chemotaxis protein
VPADHPVIRVVLAEDGVLLREGLARLLERFGFRPAAVVGDAQSLKAAVAGHVPDLVITDIRMPPTFTDEGLRAAAELRRTYPGLAVVVLSQYVQHAYAAELLDSGDGRGVGYLLKDRVADIEEFIAAQRDQADHHQVCLALPGFRLLAVVTLRRPGGYLVERETTLDTSACPSGCRGITCPGCLRQLQHYP